MQATLRNKRRFRFAGQSGLLTFALVALALFWLKPASADAIDLKVIDSADAPWTSIGRVNFAGYKSTAMCTGTLIAPDLVLTAAHCLYNRSTGRPLPVDDLLFIAGVRRDAYAARLVPACALTAEGFEPAKKPKLRDIHKDVALIVLREPSTLPPVPVLAPEDASILARETRFQSAGYRRSRRFLPTVVPACRVLGTTEETWVTDCASEAGASGGPLLVETPNGLRIAGIMSARIDDVRSAIVPFYAWQELLANPRCPKESTLQAPALRSSLGCGRLTATRRAEIIRTENKFSLHLCLSPGYGDTSVSYGQQPVRIASGYLSGRLQDAKTPRLMYQSAPPSSAEHFRPVSTDKLAFVASDTEEALQAQEDLSARYGNVPVAEADVIVALGGDGLMLQTLHRHMGSGKPIYGMNRGSVGFLMNEYREFDLKDRLALADITTIRPLEMTATTANGIHHALAINEVSLLRQTSQAARLRISVDGRVRLEELVCDGIIVATPAGSTAYNLSAHGPILPITAQLLALTPISAFRPRRWRGAILPNGAKVDIEILDPFKRPVSASADHTEIRNVTHVAVREAAEAEGVIMFDSDHGWDERILTEMFRY